jgi:CRP/FNR family transcriptional regulator, cyclic AMP receptor protein
MSLAETLHACSLFRDFSPTGLQIFAAVATEKSVPAGTPLFTENMVGESLFIVRAGTVRISRREGNGERELATVGPGEHLGELALLAKSVRLVSATAATPCDLVEISQRDFYRLQPQKPQACLKLALAIAADLAQKLAENRDTLAALGTAPRS